MSGLVLQLISGLASPFIFVPSLLIGWFVRRGWQVLLGAVVVATLSEAEVMLIELPPGATLDWGQEPLVVVAPLAWCASGFLLHAWQRRTSRLRQGAIRALPVVAGMTTGAIIVAALALSVGLLYLREGALEYHTMQFGSAPGADYDTIFFQYVFPGLLLGQMAGGMIGRVVGRPIIRKPA